MSPRGSAAAAKEKAKTNDETKIDGKEGAGVDGKKIDGWDDGVGGDGEGRRKQVTAAATGVGVSPRRRASKRDKDDPSVGSTRKPAQKMPKGSDAGANGDEAGETEGGVTQTEDEEMKSATDDVEIPDDGSSGGYDEEMVEVGLGETGAMGGDVLGNVEDLADDFRYNGTDGDDTGVTQQGMSTESGNEEKSEDEKKD